MPKAAVWWAPSAIAVELGLDRHVLAKTLKRLKPVETTVKGGRYYRKYLMSDVVDELLRDKNEDGENKTLNPPQVKAALDEERRMKVELERKELEGLLCRRSDVYPAVASMINASKSKLRGVPAKCLHQIMAADSFDTALPILESAINEALSDLSEKGFDEF